MGALARLPVFFGLAGRRAVVAGGSPGAAWKAELLASAGASVAVFAADPGEEMRALVERGAEAGALSLTLRDWRPGDLAGAALAVGDFEEPEAARRFRRAGARAGVPVNTIDRPESCDFQFGTIVNRSSVVIGISTDGAAPILAQALRLKIEALLPRALGAWGRLAQAVRDAVMARLRPGAERRRFWERFAARALSGETAPAPCAIVDALSGAAAGGGAGRITLVGAGPGDPDLLTVKALRALQAADVILFDDLVSAEVLELGRREARRIGVGKRGARASCAQGDINALMVRLAREGKHVVRLKSGDPMIFGRAGEEIAEARAAGIAVAVVPGVSAAQGLASALGVSLTHRDCAHSLTLVTGHSREGDLPATIDWRHAASPDVTTIIYMGASKAADIRAQLLAAGADPDLPVAAAASLSGPGECIWRGRLSLLPAGVASLPGGGPILIGLGRVFAPASAPAQEATTSAAGRTRSVATA